MLEPTRSKPTRSKPTCGPTRALLGTGLILSSATFATPGEGEILWDNNDAAGECSYSHWEIEGVLRRSTLDDFVVDGDGWLINGFQALHTWLTLPPGSGTGYELAVHENRQDPGFGEAEGPGDFREAFDVVHYEEITTGRVWFSREEFIAWADVEPLFLPPGRYWLDMKIVGPENCFILCAGQPQRDNQGWVNYSDLGGLQPTVDAFGAPRNGAFQLHGEVVVCPADLDADGRVGFGDVVRLLGAWGECDHQVCEEDLDDDGFVTVADLLILLATWGSCF